MSSRNRLFIAGALALFAIATLMFPIPAWILAVVTLGLWVARLTPRWGVGSALAIAYTIGSVATFAALLVAALQPLPFPLLVVVTQTTLAAAAVMTWRRDPTATERHSQDRWTIAAGASAGALFWLGGLAVARFVEGSSARSWAMWDDSAFDVRNVARYAWANGVTLGNPRPFEHAISLSLVAPSQGVDNTAAEFLAELSGHAYHWTLAIVIGTFLCGSLAAAFVPRTAPRWVSPVVAALGSLVVLAGPAAGQYIFRGQINASLVILMLAGSLLIAINFRRGPVLAFAALVLLTTLLMMTWTPFAAAPGLLAVAVGVRVWRSVSASTVRQRLPVTASVLFFVACAALFFAPNIADLTSKSTADLEGLMTTTFEATAPMSINYWVLASLAISIVTLQSLNGLRKRATVAVATWLTGIALGGATLIVTRGGFAGELAYYPSRYVHMTTIMLAPVAIGVIASALSRRSAIARVTATVAAVGIAVAAILAPVTGWVSKWRPAPVLVVAGDYYGPDDEVYDRFAAYIQEDGIHIPYYTQVPWDHAVRYMTAEKLRPRSFTGEIQWFSEVLRNVDYDPASLCRLGAISYSEITVTTIVPDLPERVAAACEDPTWDDNFVYDVISAE